MSSVKIALSSDENVVRYSLVSIMSVLEHCKNKVIVHFLGNKISTNAKECIERVFKVYSDAELVYHDISKICSQTKTISCYPTTSLARLYLPELVDGSILYLDVDTFVQEDITALFDIELENKCVAAVRDFGLLASLRKQNRKSEKLRVYAQELINPFPVYDYFNSGVMLLNCDRIKEVPFLRKAFADIDAVTTNRYLRWPDQDYLNYTLKGQVMFLNPSWNCFYGMADRAFRVAKAIMPEELVHVKEEAKIIHYAGARKPWHPFTLKSLKSMKYLTRNLSKDIEYMKNARRLLRQIE